ncbi:MAG TPA: hypothetical protein VE569_02720 [Acidimicrobiia bacterium]|nr:hypothetical protein [Acidimicrobiia bacterium]
MSDGYILFDIPAGQEPVDRAFLEQLGHPVEICHGPPPSQLCPILKGEHCPLAEGARGIVFEFDLDRPQHRAILRQYRGVLRDDVPIHVVLKPGQATQYADLVKGLKVWTHVPVAGDLDALAAEVEASEQFV